METLARTADQVIGDVETDGDPVDYDATWPASVETETGEERSDIETRWSHTIRDQLSGIVEDLAGRHPEDCDGPVVLFQTPMYGQIGVWDINGIADLMVLEPLPERRGVRSRVGGTTALIGGR